MTKSQAGKLGYLATTMRMGQKEFHRAGGVKTSGLYFYTARDGSVGYEAAVRDGKHIPKNKKHRYRKAS